MEQTLLFGFGRDVREVVRVTVTGAVGVAAVVEEVADRCGVKLAGDLAIWHSPIGADPGPLDPAAAFSTSGVRSGDALLVLGSSTRPDRSSATRTHAAAAVLDLVAVGGARCGTRSPLVAGPNGVDGNVLHVAGDASVTVTRSDGGARPRIDGRPVGPKGAPLQPGAWLQCGPDIYTLRLPFTAVAHGSEVGGRRGSGRAPRVGVPTPAPPYALPDVPGGPERSTVPLGAVLAPAAVAIVAAAVMANPVYLLFGALSPIVGAWRIVSDRRRGRRRFHAAAREFRAALVRAGSDLAGTHAAVLRARRAAAPDVDSLVGRVLEARSTLWERRRHDQDFLVLRLGVGDLPTLLEVTPGDTSPASPEALLADTRAVAAAHTHDRCVPVTVDLARGGGAVLGIAGRRDVRDALAAALVLQTAVLHSPDEIELVVVGDDDPGDTWAWARWLPHCHGRPCPLPPTVVAEHLAVWAGTGDAASGPGGRRHVVIVVTGDVDAAGRDVLVRAAGPGVSLVWCAPTRDRLPDRCNQVLVARSPASGRLVRLDPAGTAAIDLVPDSARSVDLVAVARSLAAHGDDAGAAVPAVPARAGLCETLAAFHHEDPLAPGAIRRLWDQPRRQPLRAVIGAGAGTIVSVDLDSDGPHALVVGTTGSGKSELFSTMLASLAVGTSAERLAFLLVDFKGGAAFDRLASLPHTAGVVTDLDGPLAQRVLVSLQAELRRRMEVLRGLGIGNLATCERTRPDAAPPRLVVVVDEFAALSREVPGFVDGLVDVARRGRSLGVHLLVGTQQPDAGTAKLSDNTNLRICLRVQDAQVSRDVVGTPDASRIARDMRGRAIIARGHGERVEVQAAWGGTHSGRGGRLSVVLLGREPSRDPSVSTDAAGDAETELDAVVAAVAAAWVADATPDTHPHRVWVPPPAGVVPLEDLGVGTPAAPVVGIADDAHLQRLAPMTLDLAEHASVLVTGRSGSGRTTLLRTVAEALARAGPPAEVSLYVLDFGTGALGGLAALPHCPAVVCAGEDERVDRLFVVLVAEMNGRTADPMRRRPRVVVLLDGYGAFAAAHEDWSGGHVATLRRLCEDGRGLAMHAVVAGDAASIPARVQDGFGAVVELSGAGDATGPAGRTWRVATVAGAGASTRGAATSSMPSIDVLPAEVSLADLGLADVARADVARAGTSTGPEGVLPLGLDAESRGVAGCHLEQVPLFLVAGPMRSGRSTALATLALGIGATRTVLLAPRRGPLPGLACWDEVSVGPDACEAAARRLAEEVRLRRDSDSARAEAPLAVFVDDAETLAEGAAAAALDEVARHCWDTGVQLVAAVEAHAAARSYGWLMQLRVGRHGLILQADSDLDSEIFRLRLPRRRPHPVPPGRGELVAGGAVSLIQVAHRSWW